MAAYDYRCRACDCVFTVHRSMSDVATLTRCPSGHDDVARIWSPVAVSTSGGTAKAGAAAPPMPAAGGGCCGGGCCG